MPYFKPEELSTHVGYQYDPKSPYGLLFSEESIQGIQDRIYERAGILVNLEEIARILSAVQRDYTPQTGDIFSRFHIPTDLRIDEHAEITGRCVDVIATQLIQSQKQWEINQQYSAWNRLYGDFNPVGVRAHAPIKIRRRGPQRMAFCGRY